MTLNWGSQETDPLTSLHLLCPNFSCCCSYKSGPGWFRGIVTLAWLGDLVIILLSPLCFLVSRFYPRSSGPIAHSSHRLLGSSCWAVTSTNAIQSETNII
jgi:hypothetical protein